MSSDLKENTKKFLPMNNEYNPLFHTDQEEIEKHPKKYIIEDLMKPCYILWAKNIFTYMTSDYYDKGLWIAIRIEDLSPENISYIDALGKRVNKFIREENSICIGIPETGEIGEKKLIEITSGFRMQDVPKSATIPTFEALIKCGCYKKKENPSYLTLEEYQKKFGVLSYGQYHHYFESPHAKKFLFEFDPNKIKNSVPYTLKKHGYYFDESCIYKNYFYYQKHLNYLYYLNKKEQMEELEKKL